MFKFKVNNWKPIEKALKELEPKISNKIIRKSLRGGAKIIQPEAKKNAPKDTGAVRKAIKVKAMKRKKGRIGITCSISDKDFTGDEFYGAFQEFGWKRGKRGSANRTPIKGKEFMKKAYESKKMEVRTFLENDIWRQIQMEINVR